MQRESGNKMETKTKSHYYTLHMDNLRSLAGQRDYIESILDAGGLETWETKEYSQLWEDVIIKLRMHMAHMVVCQKQGFYV